MTDPKKRADRWKAKYNLKRVNETLTDLREDMAARYEASMNQVRFSISAGSSTN